jgi:hypothetical protein
MHTDGLNERVSPYDILLARIDDVIAEWRALVEREPWSRIPPMRLVDSLPEILPKLFRDARDGAQQVSKELSELIAKAHGSFRRQDEVPLGAVAEEWIQVKHACRRVLERHGVSETDARDHVQRMDALIDDAVGYTLRGYYAPELDSLRGRGLERRDNVRDRRANPPDRRRAEGN